MIRTRSLFAVIVLALTACVAAAQVQTGTPPFGSFGGDPDVINLANLNAHLAIPVLHKPGRGTNFIYDLSYDSSVWYPVGSSGSQSWQPVFNWGWRGQTEISTGFLAGKDTATVRRCTIDGLLQVSEWHNWTNWIYHDAFGTSHAFPGLTVTVVVQDNCSVAPPPTTASAISSDGSGYTLTLDGTSTGGNSTPIITLTSRDGKNIKAPLSSGTGSGSYTDRNGNQISVSSTGVFIDTLGTTALTVSGSGTPTSPMAFTYTTPSGASASYTMKYTTYTVQTKFNCSGISDYGPTSNNLVTEIDLPDGSKYSFSYEGTPGVSGNVTGRLVSVTLPTGGTISYSYSGGNNGITCADGSAATLTRITPDGTWTYARSGAVPATTTTITDPSTPANVTVIQFQGIYETQRQVYQGSTSGTLLLTTNTCYNGASSPCNGTAITPPIIQRAVITTLPAPGSTTLQSKSVATYNSVGVPLEVDTYAFGSGLPPTTPTRKRVITYASLGNITAFQQTVTTRDGSNNPLAQTNYNYDETTPAAAPTGTAQLVSVSGSRGNLTSVQKCTAFAFGSCSNLSTVATMTYDTAGQVQTTKDAALNQTTFDYTDNYFTDNGSNPPQAYTPAHPTDAFPKTVTLPIIGAATFGYYVYSGQGALSTDQNGNNSYTHFDSFGRLSTVQGPGQGTILPWALTTYATSSLQTDTYLGITDTTASASCSSCRHDEVSLDGLGRPIHSYLVNDPEGQTVTDTVYDALGRVLSTSHPHRSAASTTDGIETPTYDALSRTIKVTHQDGTYSQSFFGAGVSGTGVNTAQLCSASTYGLGFPVLAIDEAGKKREVWIDGLGRTIEADEPDSSGNLTSNTCYSYDPLGNLLQIVHGTQTRTYAYDAVSRSTSVMIPELANSSGTNCAVTYSYDSNSNVQTSTAPAPNQTSCAATVTTTYSHDALNRLTKITYGATTPVSTPTVQYGYDGTALTGCATTPPTLTDSNPKGRMTSMCDGSGATSWAHDAAGRIVTEKRTILGVTQTIAYTYNLDGSIATATYPSSKVITYTVGNAQRLTAAKDVANNVQFATAASYVPPGGLSALITGQISGGFGGISESHNYNSRLEYTTTKATSTTGTAMDLSLSYNLSGGDNGTVTGTTNNVDHGRTLTLGYDPLNRIASATTQATSGVDCWGQNFSPDPLANLNTISNAQCSSGTLSVTVDGNNHINSSTTFAYDAAGNMTQDGKGTGYSYSFDAENRLVQATGMTGGPYCYVYDGNGLRVAKKSGANSDCTGGTVTKLYWRTISGDALAETDGSGSVSNAAYNEYVFFGGRRIASRNGSGGIFYWFADQLGSTRTITTGSGTGQTPGQLCYDADFTPYGQEISHSERLQTSACPPSYKFTGYERDPETAYGATDTGVDYAFARYYSSRLGRFLSTDPLGGSVGDLQSHNAYAYSRNNPVNLADPSGQLPLGACAIDGGCPFPIGVGGGGGNCSLEGIEVSCSLVFKVIGSGAAEGHPPGGGSGVIGGLAGTFQVWVPSACVTTIDEGSPGVQSSSATSCSSGYWSTIDIGGGGNSSGVHGQAYYFFKDFSLFGPKNDPRPSCFAAFLKELPGNFFGYSGTDIAGGVATATYILTPPSPVPPTMALRGGKYALNWIKADNAARLTKAAGTGLAANLVFAEGVALGNEIDSALNGNCK